MTLSFFRIPEAVESSRNPPSFTEHWKLTGLEIQPGPSANSFAEAYARSSTPQIVTTADGVLYRQDIQVQAIKYNQYRIRVPYGKRQNDSGNWSWDFDTTGGTVHIKNAKEEVSKYPSASAPDQKGAIAVDGTNVNGVDIVIPAMKINVQYRHPLGAITLSQAKFLNSITGKVNSDTFLTFAPGEVLFLGARGADGTDAESTVNYQFAMSANITGQTIGGIANIAKKGWEVIWIRYEDAEETGGSDTLPIRKPKFAYVDRVYDTVAMSTSLGFGG